MNRYLRLTVLILLAAVTPAFAGNLHITLNIQADIGGGTVVNNQSIDASILGTALASGIIRIPTNIAGADTTISFGTVTNAGYILIVGLTTNSWAKATFGPDGTNYPVAVCSNQVAITRWSAAALRAKAITNAVDCQYYIFPD